MKRPGAVAWLVGLGLLLLYWGGLIIDRPPSGAEVSVDTTVACEVDFKWRHLATEWRITDSEPGRLVLDVPPGFHELTYRSYGLKAKVMGADGAFSLQQTSPGFVKARINIPSGRLILEYPGAHEEGYLALLPLRKVGPNLVEMQGWFGIFLVPWVLDVIMIGVLVWLRFSGRLHGSTKAWAVLLSASWIFLHVTRLYPILFAGIGFLVFALWMWLPLPFLKWRLPEAVGWQGWTGANLNIFLDHLSPNGVLSEKSDPALLGQLVRLLEPLTGLSPLLGAGMLLVWVMGLAWWARKRLCSMPAVWGLGGLFLWQFAVHPVWAVPLPESQQRWLSILLVFGGTLYAAVLMRCLRRGKAATAEHQPIGWWWLLPIGYFLFHLPTLNLPGTFRGDHIFGAFHFRMLASGLGLWVVTYRPWVRLATALLGVIALVLLVRHRDRWQGKGWTWMLLPVLLGAFAVWNVLRPLPNTSPWEIHRYPPLYPSLLGIGRWFTGSGLWETRLVDLLLYIGAAVALARAGEAWGFGRRAAWAGAAVFLFSPLVFYWSSFSYHASAMLLFMALSLLAFARWWRDQDPRQLAWLGLWLAACCASRTTGLVMVGSVFLFIGVRGIHEAFGFRFRSCTAGLWLGVAVGVPFLLWRRLVGWFDMAGRELTTEGILWLVRHVDQWRMAPFAFVQTNGVWLLFITWIGLGLALATPRFRIAGLFMTVFFIADYAFQYFLGHVAWWHGYGRFLVPLMLSSGVAAMAVVEQLGSRMKHPVAGWGLVVVLVLPVGCNIRYRLLDAPCVFPTDVAPYVQWNGDEHAFSPEDFLHAELEIDDLGGNVALLMPNLMLTYALVQVPFDHTQSIAGLEAYLEEEQKRYVVTMDSPQPACRAKLWGPMKTQVKVVPEIYQDLKQLPQRSRLRLVRTLPWYHYELLLFELPGAGEAP